jgi:hypothetical protein
MFGCFAVLRRVIVAGQDRRTAVVRWNIARRKNQAKPARLPTSTTMGIFWTAREVSYYYPESCALVPSYNALRRVISS